MNEIVRVSGLRVAARNEEGVDVPIVHGADFSLNKGEVLALIGESGSGKSTIALSLMGYARAGCRIVGGSVRIGDVDVLKLSNAELAKLRGRTVAYIAQSAAAASKASSRASPFSGRTDPIRARSRSASSSCAAARRRPCSGRSGRGPNPTLRRRSQLPNLR